jgi:hypothetical protein
VKHSMCARDLIDTSDIDLPDAAVRLGRFVRMLQQLDAAPWSTVVSGPPHPGRRRSRR